MARHAPLIAEHSGKRPIVRLASGAKKNTFVINEQLQITAGATGRSVKGECRRAREGSMSSKSDSEVLTEALSEEIWFLNRKILCVDGEPAGLRCYQPMLGRGFDIVTATSGEEGLALLRSRGPFAVVIADLRLVDRDGEPFLKRAHQVAPNTIRLLVAENLDLNGAVSAVNEGCVFRLLSKPCDKVLLRAAVSEALDCYRARKEERPGGET
jgi:CheY-like chemotaxis protein